jgi:hypothetical protein
LEFFSNQRIDRENKLHANKLISQKSNISYYHSYVEKYWNIDALNFFPSFKYVFSKFLKVFLIYLKQKIYDFFLKKDSTQRSKIKSRKFTIFTSCNFVENNRILDHHIFFTVSSTPCQIFQEFFNSVYKQKSYNFLKKRIEF